MDALMLFAASESVMDQVASWVWVILGVGGGLGFVIFVHELGHFLVAKACGVKCEKFYIGFDLFNLRFCRFKWGETEYGIGVLPLGGYVKMLGQDDDPRQAMAEMERCKVANEAEAARTQALAEGTAAEGLTPGQSIEKPQATPAKTYELDPRSYPAKPVLARMAIISAGVTMNVIFGVLLAAWAYGLGVPETPAMIGITVPGTPAWNNNLEPGTRIIAFGKDGEQYEHYRFEDVKTNIIFNGDDRDLTLTVREPDGEERSVSLRPALRDEKKSEFPTIGFVPAHGAEIAVTNEIPAHLRPQTSVPLKDKDRVVAINGIRLDSDTGYDPKLDGIMAQNPSLPLTMSIERAGEQEGSAATMLDVVVQARPMRDVGVVMKMGPIVAVRADSPAERAGFRPGDVILKVNGNDVGDPMSLGQRLLPAAGSTTEYTFVVVRKGADGKVAEQELTVTAEPPRQYTISLEGGPTSIESIGVAYSITQEVAAVAPESSARTLGLLPGDKIIAARFTAVGPREIDREEKIFGKEIHEEIKLDGDVHSWTYVHSVMQNVLPDTTLRLKVQRGKETKEFKLQPEDSSTFYDEQRGLTFYPLRVTHKAESFGEALSLGGREVRERMVDVVATISHLLSRRVSPKHLMGPVGIIRVAGGFASEGLPTLLIFLTILSANLAVLNFLPIPVLDGGHMLFLAWEGITRKPVNPNVQGYLSLAGLVLLLSLMIFATAMDFNRFFS